MKKKRLDRDKNWGFQNFPYYQFRVDIEEFHGLVSLIQLTDGEYYYWDFPKAKRAPVCGKGMMWLQLVPDHRKHMITVKYMPKSKEQQDGEPENVVSVWYVDMIEGIEYAEDGVAVFVDKYLDVIFTPQGDVKIDDRDELDAAYTSGKLTTEQYEGALEECDRVIEELCTDVKATETWCAKILDYVEEQIRKGMKPYKETCSEKALTHVYFVRHAQPNYNNHDDYSRELTQKGLEDRKLVTKYLMDKSVDVVLSSPYLRSVDTVEDFADTCGLTIETIADFRERKVDSCWIEDFYSFSKKQWEDFDYKLSDGECLREVQERNIAALKKVLKRCEGKNIVVGSHGTALSTIVNYYDASFGFEQFEAIRALMPWVVHFQFVGEKCVGIEQINLFEV